MRRTAAFLAATLAALCMVAGSSAANGNGKGAKTVDLSSPAAISNYLLSIGVDPSTVVTQTGLNNYAGPNCPGVGWTCTTATKVVQLAAPGGQNVDECNFSFQGVCLVIQQSDTRNTAKCVEHESNVQHCSITQTGTRNFARVDQLVKDDSSSSAATQTAYVLQEGATQMNELQLDQDVDQTATNDATQAQDAHQYVELNQTAAANGNNFAHVHQSQDQNESGAATLQSQNTNPLVTPLSGDAETTETDCTAASTDNGVPDPNACATINQSSENGDNDAHLHQLANQSEKSSTSSTQTQDTATNGLGGGFEQTVSGSGSNHNETVQQKQQQEHANGGTQTQFDPIGCCGASQLGGQNDRDDVNQFNTQSASGGTTYTQDANLLGRTDIGSFGEAPTTSGGGNSGECSVSHHVRQNDASTNENVNQPAPCSLSIETHCASASATTDPGTCAAPPPCISEVCYAPTAGADLPALDVTSEPTSYSTPSWYVSF